MGTKFGTRACPNRGSCCSLTVAFQLMTLPFSFLENATEHRTTPLPDDADSARNLACVLQGRGHVRAVRGHDLQNVLVRYGPLLHHLWRVRHPVRTRYRILLRIRLDLVDLAVHMAAPDALVVFLTCTHLRILSLRCNLGSSHVFHTVIECIFRLSFFMLQSFLQNWFTTRCTSPRVLQALPFTNEMFCFSFS